MKEEQNRVEKTKRKKRAKTAILIILFLLVIGGAAFALVNSKNLFSDHTAKSKHVSISSETKESKSKSSTSSSHVSNRDESKKEVATTDLSNEQVVEWINYVVDNWEKANNIAWPYTVDRLNDLNGRDSNSIYYSIIFQNPKYPMMILRINSDGFMEFETNTVDATKNKNFEYKVLSKKYKDISLINELNISELTKVSSPENEDQQSQIKEETNRKLDTEAITKGDFSTLAGIWKNGEGNSLVIKNDGSVNDNLQISGVGEDYSGISNISVQPKIPAAGGFLIYLFEAGEVNPEGDNSDQSKDRIVGTQNFGPFPFEKYYYRQ
ncbi:DUF6287 domain-containing protein [Enterococcus faecalis]|uniref:DUF6287 domain-containing protein n=1 Tax=Enterococcus faecalis TaxID=1351 RepID=UPI001E4CB33C|nr:DUF6287 domain-containing protein [Enterococcus faecalis]